MNNQVSTDEFEGLMELVTTVLLMCIGIIGIAFMIRQLAVQTDVVRRVDKVRVNPADIEGDNPFTFTGYQAYMFAWMMDGHYYGDLYWSSDVDALISDIDTDHQIKGDSIWVKLSPSAYRGGFIVIRNRMIIGASEFSNYSVKKTLEKAYSNTWSSLADLSTMYRTPCFKLELSANHYDPTYNIQYWADDAHTTLLEERKDYIWMLHPCSH